MKIVCVYKSQKAFTLLEVIVSVAIIVIVVAAASSTILNSHFLASYSKHKLQAMYVAQQIIEQERRMLFTDITSQPALPVTMDTNGTYNDATDDFLGNAVITVADLDANRKQVQVEVDWQEQVGMAGKLTMREYYSTIISNDPIPN